jgi:hypothetical protein
MQSSFWAATAALCLVLFAPLPALGQDHAPEAPTYDVRAHLEIADHYSNAATQLYVTSVLLLLPALAGGGLGAIGVQLASDFPVGDAAGAWLLVSAGITAMVGHVLTMALAIAYDAMSAARRHDAMDHLPRVSSLALRPSISPDGAGLWVALSF